MSRHLRGGGAAENGGGGSLSGRGGAGLPSEAGGRRAETAGADPRAQPQRAGAASAPLFLSPGVLGRDDEVLCLQVEELSFGERGVARVVGGERSLGAGDEDHGAVGALREMAEGGLALGRAIRGGGARRTRATSAGTARLRSLSERSGSLRGGLRALRGWCPRASSNSAQQGNGKTPSGRSTAGAGEKPAPAGTMRRGKKLRRRLRPFPFLLPSGDGELFSAVAGLEGEADSAPNTRRIPPGRGGDAASPPFVVADDPGRPGSRAAAGWDNGNDRVREKTTAAAKVQWPARWNCPLLFCRVRFHHFTEGMAFQFPLRSE